MKLEIEMPILDGSLTFGDQKRLSFFFGVGAIFFVLAAIILVFLLEIHEVPNVWALVEFFLRTVTALCAGGIIACVPGFLEIDWKEKRGIRAGGAVAAFLLVFLVNPPSLVTDAKEGRDVVSIYDYCKANIKFQKHLGEDVRSRCSGMLTAYPDHWRSDLIRAKLALVDGNNSAGYHAVRAAVLLSLAQPTTAEREETQEAAKEIFNTLRHVPNLLHAHAWATSVENAVRTKLNMSPEQDDRTDQLFYTLFSASNAATRVREDLLNAHDLADEAERIFIELPANSSKRLYYAFCARSWHDTLYQKEIDSSMYQGKFDAIVSKLEEQPGTQATKRRLECLMEGRVCEEYVLAMQWCPGLEWVDDIG